MKRNLLLSLFLSAALFANSQTTIIDSIFSGGIYRNYRLYVPAAYNGTSAWPLIFNLHGYTSSASAQQLYTNFGPIADTAHFLMVYPNGTTFNGQPYWNSWGAGADDLGFLSNLIDSLSASYNIDANRVYSCGMSNGGFMSYSLACGLSSRIAAIASVTGSMSAYTRSVCSPSHPVPVMEIHGTADGTVAYAGASGSYLHIDTVVKYWRQMNGCNPTAVFSNVPNINTSDGCTAEHYVYNNGINGSSVELYKVIGGGHTWPFTYPIGVTNQDFNASEKIWLFFRKYKLNQLVGISEPLENPSALNIFPNPVTDLVTIEAEGFLSLNIIDLSGKTIINSNKKQVDISSLAKGIYSVMIITEKGRHIRKLVKI
ncbi:MAG TPA: T9SS type A sorting domain-containing protein [Bacteroidia bacterium]